MIEANFKLITHLNFFMINSSFHVWFEQKIIIINKQERKHAQTANKHKKNVDSIKGLQVLSTPLVLSHSLLRKL